MSKVQTPAGDYENIKKAINEITRCLDTLSDNEEKVPIKIKNLKKFYHGFEKRMESADLEDDQFEELIDQGSTLIDKIEKIMSFITKYEDKSINFEKFSQILKPKKQAASPAPPPKAAQPQPEIQQKAEPKKAPQIKQSQKQPSKDVQKDDKKKQLKKLQINIESPVKKEGQNVSFSDGKSISSLPRESVSKDFEPPLQKKSKVQIKSKPEIEQINIVPASHQKFAKSQKEMEQDLKKYLFKEQTQSPVKSKANLEQSQNQSKSKKHVPQNHSQSKLPHSTVKNIIEEKSEGLRRTQQKVSSKLNDSSIKNSNTMDRNLDKIENVLYCKKLKAEQNEKSMRQYENISALEMQEENNLHIKTPKNLKNVNGSYKFKNQEPQSLNIPEKKEKLNESRASNNSNIKFQESQITQKDEDDDDMIMMPDINPLELSYHEIDLETNIKGNKDMSFKKCFQAEKYLLGQQKNAKMFWLQNTTTSLIKTNSSKVRGSSRNKESSLNIVPQMLNQKNKKHQEELKYIQEQKNRKILQLQGKIKKLQNQGKNLKDKIYEQDKEIKSFRVDSSIDASRTKKNSYIEDQDLLFKSKLNTVQKHAKDRSTYEEQKKEPKYLDPQGKLINIRKFNQYFSHFKDQKKRKLLLKSKELIHKDDLIQIGSMNKRDNRVLNVTFYITPEQDLQGLTVNLIPILNDNIEVKIEPKNIGIIRSKKQQKINVSINVNKAPFELPEIEFLYNINNKMYSQKCLIPCSFHKFVQLQPCEQRELISQFKSASVVIRGEEVPYSKKILKNMSLLTEFFTNGQLLRGGGYNENGEVQFGGSASWGRESFYLKIVVKPNQFLYVQAACQSQSESIEYYVSLLTKILMKNVQLSEIQ